MQKKVNKYKQNGTKTVVNCSNLIERQSWSPVTVHFGGPLVDRDIQKHL